MSLINSFNGIRPKVRFANKITSPHISYLNKPKISKEANFLNILNSKKISTGKKMLDNLKKLKKIKRDDLKSYYLYKITYKKKSIQGIVGKINLDNYDDKKILGHEETFSDRIRKRKKQLIKFNTQISPIYTAYKINFKKKVKLNKLFMGKATYRLRSKDDCMHEMWIINKESRKKIVENYLKRIKRIFICDGHHRIQAMLKSKKKIAPMVIAFPDKQVSILDYNRVVKSKIKFEKLKKIILKKFSIQKLKRNRVPKNGEIQMFSNNSWYLLNLLKKQKELDVTILKKNILNKIVRNDKAIKYISGIKGRKILEKYVQSKEFNLAFRMCPTDISQVISFAEKRKFMPPKSTWFHPKPLDGLISSEIIY